MKIESVVHNLKNPKIEYKHLIFTQKYAKKLYSEAKNNAKGDNDFEMDFVIPEGVKEIEKNCFDNMSVKSLRFPSTLKIIEPHCFLNIQIRFVFVLLEHLYFVLNMEHILLQYHIMLLQLLLNLVYYLIFQ